MAAKTREAALGYGARSTLTITLSSTRSIWGHHGISTEEGFRDGRSGEFWRRRSSRPPSAGKPFTKGFA
jgi:hypothetical protein